MIDVPIRESGGPLRGMGEPPGGPPLAPAPTNALYFANGLPPAAIIT